jgi:hypothetical protein
MYNILSIYWQGQRVCDALCFSFKNKLQRSIEEAKQARRR